MRNGHRDDPGLNCAIFTKTLCKVTKYRKSLDKWREMCYNDINDGGNRRKNRKGRAKFKMYKCIRSYLVKEYFGFHIYKEFDKKYDDIIDTYSGHEKVFYTVIDPCEDEMVGCESFKTLSQAEAYIRQII